MATTSTIEILWPAVQLSETGWRQRVEDLATRAESLIGRKCTLQQTAELALELVGLIWPALGAETVAASARASLVTGVPGILASSPFDQAAEIHQRLDQIFAAAQDDPAAAAIEMPSPMLQRIVPESHGGRPKRVRAQPQVDEPEDHQGEPELIPEPVEADHLHELPEPPQAVEAIQQLDAWGFLVEPEPEPSPAPLPPAPADWFTAADAAELLGISKSTILRWCKQGRLGAPGENWLPAGRTFKVNPEILDALLGVQEPAAPTCH
ncbi:helix-turn-helix domain-containing protein [Cyanobium sp. BA5m-10]|uniref:helix-turn-helix domain-containing protein n=1 Tax=Cyanobium sp. BA5m-10 TaxID=2823705 RepID=UPI0020CD5271|nr:helix-turn-helix domain-containing protein [Cyanobium sp. BA5m-10]MCP9905498.1 helix-turn-helix domain-containing protein [Cyanobium sp. BA5m-10]